jgi:hypothetical protein
MAIAFDSSASTNNSTASSRTWSHTCSGSNRILFVGLLLQSNITCTGVTYNGVAMTQLATKSNGSNNYIYYLIAPDTGIHNVVASFSGSGYNWGASASYTGAKQSEQPDAYNTGQSNNSSSVTCNVTTVADKCWVVSWAGRESQSVQLSASTGLTGRSYCLINGVSNGGGIGDSNSEKSPCGSYTTTWSTNSNEGGNNIISASFAPVLPVPIVTTQAVSAITNTTATGNGNVTSDGGTTITQRGVCIGASANPTTGGTKFTTTGTTGAFTVSMTGLTKNTHYHARAYAINSVATSYGSDVEFDTTNTPDELRDFTNRAGIEYDAEKTTVVFAEDMALLKEWIEYLNSKL